MRFTADKAGGISALSRTSGVATRTIKGYIDGDNDPTRKKLIAMAEAANVSVEWLATGKGAMRPGEGDKIPNDIRINQLEDPLIKDIKLWLRDMTTDNPAWRSWFEIELIQKIPQFAEWRKKNQPGNPDQNSAAG